MQGSTKPVQGAQSIYRAFQLLECVFELSEGATLAELCRQSGLNSSTAFRILAVLEDLGYVRKGDDDVYRPGFKPLLLTEKLFDTLDVRSVAHPILKELSHQTKEVCHLVIRDGLEAVYIDKVEDNSQTIRMHSRVGKRAPLHCTAVGKVLLAGMDDDSLEKILPRLELKRFTENTITTLEHLRAEIDRVRRDGYALDRSEHEDFIKCVAAPVYDAHHAVKAAISISVPAIRFPPEREPQLLELLLDSCQKVSKQLGDLHHK
ncbi:MAG TPA: IclR family transcriptional regulator [Thermoanaerobacterium sp.]|nr:IclR family transcriptional regulator [Thermoanaerobacterium sp.]